MPKTYEPIATTTLTGLQNSVTFSSITSSYTDLIIVFEGTATGSNVKTIKFNGDTGANYSCTTITGNGTSALSGQYTNSYLDVTNSFSNRQMTIVHVMNYANSTTNKTYLSRHSCAAVCTDTVVGLWRSTAAITSITINTGTANDFNAGSVFTLYGIKAA
jgi:hypothetical protein